MNMRLPLVLVVSVLLLGATPLPEVQVRDGKLTVSVQDISLDEVLATIGKQAQLTTTLILGKDSIKGATVNDDFSGLPLAQGIKRLLHGWNYALLTNKETGVPRKLIILGRTGEPGTPGAQQNLPGAPVIPDNELEASLTAKAVENAKGQAPAFEMIQATQDIQAIKLGLQSADPEQRLMSLGKLEFGGGMDDAALQNVRTLAENDADPAVQAAALDQLIRNDTSPEAQQVLARLANGQPGPMQEMASHYIQGYDEAALLTLPATLPQAKPQDIK